MVFDIDNKKRLSIKWCDTEDWSNDAAKSSSFFLIVFHSITVFAVLLLPLMQRCKKYWNILLKWK